jgi:hypothetical protein
MLQTFFAIDAKILDFDFEKVSLKIQKRTTRLIQTVHSFSHNFLLKVFFRIKYYINTKFFHIQIIFYPYYAEENVELIMNRNFLRCYKP